MVHSISFHLLLLVIGVILLQSLIVDHPNVAAYNTYEIVKYCRRQQPSKEQFSLEELGKITKHVESKIGLIVPEIDEQDNDDDEDNGKLKAAKSVTVDSAHDDSSIRIVLSNEENRLKQRNWQYCSLFVAAKKPNGLIVTIRKLHLRSGVDWLRLVINNGTFVREFSHVKIDDERDSVAYVANHGVLIELLTGYSVKSPPEENHIELTLTAFREADLCMIDQEFDCGSFRCISNYYLCDGVNNCGDGRDETGCPMDNLTNYIIISCILLLVSMFIFLCFCYRCCCQSPKRKNYPNRAKQYQYVKIRTSSIAAPNGIVKRRASSVASESDIGPLPSRSNTMIGGIPGRHNSIAGDNLRRFRLTHVADSMPVLIPSAPSETDYGTTGNTYMHLAPYPTYATIQLGSNGYGLIPAHQIFAPGGSRVSYGAYNQPSSSRQQTSQASGNEPHTFPLPQPTYPMLHPQLFTPPAPAPPPYSPRQDSQQASKAPQAPPAPAPDN